jgi:hypothetical protein
MAPASADAIRKNAMTAGQACAGQIGGRELPAVAVMPSAVATAPKKDLNK